MDKSVSSPSSATNSNHNDDIAIIRVAGHGQFKVNQSTMAKINQIDNEIVDMLKKDNSSNSKTDENQFRNKIKEMVSVITREGKPLEDKDIVVSNIIVPSADDLSIQEAKNMFRGEGIVPEK